MRLRGLLFDKDGTLLDFNRTWLPVYRAAALRLAGDDEERAAAMLEAAGYDAVANHFAGGSLLTVGTTDQLIDLWQPGLDRETRRGLVGEIDDLFAAGTAEHLEPVAGLGNALSLFLDDGYILGIATNDGTRSAELCVDKLGLAASFSFVTGYDGVENAKPAADMAHAFCVACNLQTSEIAVIGDNSHDLEMGTAAGVGLRVGVLTGNAGREELAPHADLVLDSIVDLPAELRRLSN